MGIVLEYSEQISHTFLVSQSLWSIFGAIKNTLNEISVENGFC